MNKLNRRSWLQSLIVLPFIGGHFSGIEEGGKIEMPLDEKFYQEFVFALPQGVEFKTKPTTVSDLFEGVGGGSATMGYFQTTKPVRMVFQEGFVRFEVK